MNAKKFYNLAIGLLSLLTSFNVHSACSKDDINYYLEKGFTTDQVTALCSDEIISSKKEETYRAFSDEYADEQDEEYVRKMRIERQVFFKSALGATNVKIRGDKLSFNTYECAKDGLAKPGADLNKKGCAVVLSIVNLSKVNVSEKEFKEKVFFGSRSILVTGDVVNKIIGGMEGLSDYDANVLKKKVMARMSKTEGSVLVPIKKGLNFDYALETFKEIVAFHKGLLDKKKLGQNLGGQLEVDDFDLSQDAEYIIEEKKSELNFSNEKDDSIDGTIVFDDMPLDESNTTNDNDEIPESVFD